MPAEYGSFAVSHPDAGASDVVYLYAAYARDRKNGVSEASNFNDALKRHYLIDQIVQSSKDFFK